MGFTGVQAQTQRLPPVRPGRAARCSVRFLQWGRKGAWRAAAAGHLLSLVLLVIAQGWLLAEPPAPGPSPRDGVAQLPGPPGSLGWAAPSLTWGPLRLGLVFQKACGVCRPPSPQIHPAPGAQRRCREVDLSQHPGAGGLCPSILTPSLSMWTPISPRCRSIPGQALKSTGQRDKYRHGLKALQQGVAKQVSGVPRKEYYAADKKNEHNRQMDKARGQ